MTLIYGDLGGRAGKQMSASHYVTSLILSVSSYLDRCSAGPTGGRQVMDVMQAESLTIISC